MLLPTIIKAIGFDPLTANLYTIIPYSFAIVIMPVGCWVSDKYQARAKPYAAFCSLSLVGFVILLSTTNKVAAMAGCCFVAAGCYPNICIGIAWNNTTHGGWTKRSTAFAIAQFTFQAYGIIATQVVRSIPVPFHLSVIGDAFSARCPLAYIIELTIRSIVTRHAFSLDMAFFLHVMH